MIQLDAVDEAPILKLSSRDSLASVQVILEAIAQRHGVDWRGWPHWKCSNGWTKLLSWLALENESPAYESMVAFAFQSAWMLERDPARLPEVFDGFVDSMHALGLRANSPDEDEKRQAAEQAKRAIAAMFIAAGPSGVRLAYVAMSHAFAQKRADWLADGWREAMTEFGRADLDDPAIAPGTSGGKPPL